MKMEISRVSDWNHTAQPCKNAYKGIAKWTNAYGDQQEEVWFIDINDLDDLFTLMNEVGCGLILDDHGYDESTSWNIRIYDGYNE